MKGVQGLLVRDGVVGHLAGISPEGMLGPDPRVVQSGADGVRIEDLSLVILEDIRLAAMKNPRGPGADTRGVFARIHAVPGGLDADQFDAGLIHKRYEDPHGIAAPTDTRDDGVRQAIFEFHDLMDGLVTDHALKIPNHGRVRVRTGDAADHVKRVTDFRHPAPQGFTHGILQRACATGDGLNPCPQQLHPLDVWRLAHDIFLAHVDDAFHAEKCGHGRRGDAMLPGAGFCHQLGLSHPARQHGLPDGVVDLVCARMIEILALEVDPWPAVGLCEPGGQVQRRRTPDIALQGRVVFGHKGLILDGVLVGVVQFDQGRHQGLGDVTSAVIPEVAQLIR